MQTAKKHPIYQFTLILEAVSPLTAEHLDALFEAGCDDATFGQRGPVYYADFDRAAPTLTGAVQSAVRDVEGAISGLRVSRVESVGH